MPGVEGAKGKDHDERQTGVNPDYDSADSWFSLDMLFMVIERFKNMPAMAERFQRHGRMLPDGVNYQASWMDIDGSKCFQMMEAPSEEVLGVWLGRWNDLVDFEIVRVLTSQDYWVRKRGDDARSLTRSRTAVK